jgi:hypothetical protein
MRHLLITIGVIFCLAGTSARAGTFLLTGGLDDGGVPASGVLSFELALIDDADVVLWQEQQENVVVVAGVFAVDVGAAQPLPPGLPATARLRVTIEGDALPAFPLTRLGLVDRASTADRSSIVRTAGRVAGVTAGEVVRVSDVAVGGGPTAPFAAVTGLPDGVANGDDGTDVQAAVAGLSLVGRELSVASSISGDRFAAGVISGGRFVNDTVPTQRVAAGAVTGVKVAGDLTRTNLAGDIGEAQVAGRSVFTNAAGCAGGGITTASTCAAESCLTGAIVNGLPVIGRRPCDGSDACSNANPTTCSNARVGRLVAP